MDQILTEKGVTLIGEAAKMYVIYKYFDSILFFLCVIILGFAIYKGMKYIVDN